MQNNKYLHYWLDNFYLARFKGIFTTDEWLYENSVTRDKLFNYFNILKCKSALTWISLHIWTFLQCHCHVWSPPLGTWSLGWCDGRWSPWSQSLAPLCTTAESFLPSWGPHQTATDDRPCHKICMSKSTDGMKQVKKVGWCYKNDYETTEKQMIT